MDSKTNGYALIPDRLTERSVSGIVRLGEDFVRRTVTIWKDS